MLTEKYGEQNSIASKIAGTVTSYRITLLDNGDIFNPFVFGLHALACEVISTLELDAKSVLSGWKFEFWKGHNQIKFTIAMRLHMFCTELM